MSSSEIIRLLRTHGLRVFTTSDLITLSGLKGASATQALARLARRGLLARVKRGVWANRLVADLNPCEAVSFLRAPWPAYVSLYSALADYGVVEEIPHAIYSVTSAMPKSYSNALGDFRFHHLPPRLLWGFELRRVGGGQYPAAEREKAFLDLVYLALTPRSPLRFPHKRGRKWDLDTAKLAAYAKRFEYEPLEKWLKENGVWPSKR